MGKRGRRIRRAAVAGLTAVGVAAAGGAVSNKIASRVPEIIGGGMPGINLFGEYVKRQPGFPENRTMRWVGPEGRAQAIWPTLGDKRVKGSKHPGGKKVTAATIRTKGTTVNMQNARHARPVKRLPAGRRK